MLGAMTAMDWHGLWMAFLVFWVAMLYASVGHGGASGYQAVLSFFAIPVRVMAGTALCLNILVAGASALNYRRAGYFQGRLTWPFLLASIPTAFIGGLVSVPETVYSFLLGAVLLFAAWRLSLSSRFAFGGNPFSDTLPEPIHPAAALLSGGLIGLLSGMLGIGGGIFLSPLLLLMRWADAKQAAAASAVFILVNAVFGLLGRMAGHNLALGNLGLLIPAAVLGGGIGAYWGARRFNQLLLRRLLSVTLLLASGKLFWSFFNQLPG